MGKKAVKELPPLCRAVKQAREIFGDTQERFARRIGVAVMTISKFETGYSEPRDPRVLLNLSRVMGEKMEFINLRDPQHDEWDAVWKVFSDAYRDWERIQKTDREVGLLESQTQFRSIGGVTPASYFRGLREWRLSVAGRLMVQYFSEQVEAMEKAAAPAISLIDEVLSKADETQIDYARFEREIFALAERRALLELKQERKEQ
jgi:transcriptional regulator with XRE-family HTH domain